LKGLYGDPPSRPFDSSGYIRLRSYGSAIIFSS
jgi:hypothetical protein